MVNNSKKLLSDPELGKHAFLNPPENAIVYFGFPLVYETITEGYIYGAITDFLEADSDEGFCTYGDGFVQAPDGTRAGLIWGISSEPFVTMEIPPEDDRWGVYQVGFVKKIKNIDDLVYNFKLIVPMLKTFKE